MNEFFQDGPQLDNPFSDDPILPSLLARPFSGDQLKNIEKDLTRLGGRVIDEIHRLGDQAEREPPELVPYDAWGRRIDEIRVSEAWKKLDRISAEEKLVATAYERAHGELSRVLQFARVYLFGPSSAIYTCPLAMTDGAARAIELYGDEALKRDAFSRLTSADPKRFWTSGQWMTERTGGSDVSGTTTVARRDGDHYRLYGTKWFTSATTSQMAMTLARIEGSPEGSRGLSLFYVELRDAKTGGLNGIRVHRLKDKLGTRALPTAELSLEGTVACLVGGEGGGVKKISSLFNITRIWNACCALGYMRRGVTLARDYSKRRRAFGKLLSEHPLHLETLASLETEVHAAFHMVFHVAQLLGREESGKASAEESALLRILTPIVKLYTAKQAVAVSSEVLESFGGAGYVEDTGLPRILRDSQVLSIWEGTTNILSLDMLRAIEKENALEPLLKSIESQARGASSPELSALQGIVLGSLKNIREQLALFTKASEEEAQSSARKFAFSLARLHAASLMIAHADWALKARRESDAQVAVAAAERWCKQPLVLDLGGDGETIRAAKDILRLV